ncbi:TRPM2 [Mytilus coruscus]|uniref:TRPM2 n=1 Tax=Mytilus coruscus TaxID=42192 RepID=A0A6J8CTG3_MYTCO|nr:TRPM2 [Mytilus coruscus]
MLPSTRIRKKEIHVKESTIHSEDLSQILCTLQRSLAADEHSCLPGLVLAVVGDSESYVPKPWNTTAFTYGLLQSIQGVKKSWIIYRGNNDGISELIYKAFRETTDTPPALKSKEKSIKTTNKNTLIAIRPLTENNEADDDNVAEPDWLFTLKPVFEDLQTQMKYRWFNRYLSHFLEKLSAEYTPLLSKEEDEKELVLINMRVPVLMIAVEGDISTIHQIKSAVKRNIPVLLAKGSGKAVDFIIEYLEESKPITGTQINIKDYKSLKKRMISIQKHSHLITIFDLDNTKNYQMEDFVVKTIIKGWSLKEIHDSTDDSNDKGKSSARTVTMNNVETERTFDCLMEHFHVTPGSLSLFFYIAYQYILESCEIKNKKKELELFLLEAIISSRVDYVSALVQHGVKFNINYIGRLFDETLKCINCDARDCRRIHAIHFRVSTKCCYGVWCTCKDKCKKHRLKCGVSECEVYHYVCELESKNGEQTLTCCSTKKFKNDCRCSRHRVTGINGTCHKLHDLLQNVHNICQELLHYPKDVLDTNGEQAQKRCSVVPICSGFSRKKINDHNDLYHVLLAWAIFAQKEELASIFWAKCENPLLTAIMASSMMKTMAEMVNAATDLKLNKDLLKHSRLFEKRALFLMNSLYEEDGMGCMSLMNTEDKVWGVRVAPVECAFDNGMIDVVCHPCVQRLLNRVWYKDTAAMWRDWMKILFCISISSTDPANAWASPAMMFLIHYLIMLGMLVGYSAFLLSNIKGINTFRDIGVYELLLYLWITADAVEEIFRNIVITVQRNISHNQSRKRFRLYCYLTNLWNVLALLSYAVLVSAVLVRTFNGSQRFEIRLYSLGLFIMYMRFFHSLMVLTYFGPKLIMIGKMLKELLQFSWILFVFIMCAGVLYHSNMYPNHRDMWPNHGADTAHWRIWKIISLPYWQLYGELFLDELKGETNSSGSCTSVELEWESNPDIERCVEYDWAIMVIAAMYMLISNLLLFNLIIALFSYRFKEVQNNSDRLWKYWRYAIIKDYSTRFPVPFNVLLHVFNCICNLCKRKRPNCIRQNGNQRVVNTRLKKCIEACSLEPDTLIKLQSKYANSRLYNEMTRN